MSEVDPYKVMRNSATLQAWRDYQRAAWLAAQPWMTMGIVVTPVLMGLSIFTFSKGPIRRLGLLPELFMLVPLVFFVLAGFRMAAFKRAHPFVWPEPTSATPPINVSPPAGRFVCDRIPLNRAEVAVLCLVYLCMGVALGAFTASPYPLTSHQWDEVFSFYLVGMIVFVWLSIHRINKEWKFRTMPPPTE